MLFTKTRRRWLFGGTWTLYWLAGVVVIWLGSLGDDIDPESISSRYIPDSFIAVGFIDWLWLTGRHVIVPMGVAPTTAWTVEFQWSGVIANLLATGLLLWLCHKGWRRDVNRYTVPSSNCDSCGYQLIGLRSPLCPECGEVRLVGNRAHNFGWAHAVRGCLPAFWVLLMATFMAALALGPFLIRSVDGLLYYIVAVGIVTSVQLIWMLTENHAAVLARRQARCEAHHDEVSHVSREHRLRLWIT